MKNVKVVIIGCGRVAEHYKKIFKILNYKKFKIVGVCDINTDKAASFSKYFNCQFDTNLEDLITKTKADLAIISTPSGSHYNLSKIALKKNVNVLVEKPACLFPKHIKELDKISKQQKLLFCVAFQNRFNSSIQIAKNNINRLGKIVSSSVVLRWCRYQEYYNDEWHGTWLNDGGVTNQQAIHHIDALNYLIGPVQSVITSNSNRLNNLEAEDTSLSVFNLKNGSSSTLELTTASRPKDFEASISILGENGRISIGGIALNKITAWEFKNKNKIDKSIHKFSINVPNGYGFSHSKIFDGMINAILNKNNKFIIRGIDTLDTCRIIHSMYVSNEKKKWISLSQNAISKKLGSK